MRNLRAAADGERSASALGRSDPQRDPFVDDQCGGAGYDRDLAVERGAYGEVRGGPHSLEMPIRQAPDFYFTYIACVGLAAAIVLIPGAPLQLIILGVQVLAGIMLPSAIIFLQLLLCTGINVPSPRIFYELFIDSCPSTPSNGKKFTERRKTAMACVTMYAPTMAMTTTAHARNQLRRNVADGGQQRAQSPAYELGRGHRREWQQKANYAVGAGGLRAPARPQSRL